MRVAILGCCQRPVSTRALSVSGLRHWGVASDVRACGLGHMPPDVGDNRRAVDCLRELAEAKRRCRSVNICK